MIKNDIEILRYEKSMVTNIDFNINDKYQRYRHSTHVIKFDYIYKNSNCIIQNQSINVINGISKSGQSQCSVLFSSSDNGFKIRFFVENSYKPVDMSIDYCDIKSNNKITSRLRKKPPNDIDDDVTMLFNKPIFEYQFSTGYCDLFCYNSYRYINLYGKVSKDGINYGNNADNYYYFTASYDDKKLIYDYNNPVNLSRVSDYNRLSLNEKDGLNYTVYLTVTLYVNKI